MPQSFANRQQTAPDNSLVMARPIPAKAELHDNAGQNLLSEVVIEAAKASYGKQGAAAAHLGKDEGNFSRDVKAKRTTLRDLEALGPGFLAQLGHELIEQFEPLADPKTRARRTCDQLQALVNELRQFVDAA